MEEMLGLQKARILCLRHRFCACGVEYWWPCVPSQFQLTSVSTAAHYWRLT